MEDSLEAFSCQTEQRTRAATRRADGVERSLSREKCLCVVGQREKKG